MGRLPQEILTDPSYKGQFVAFTHVHIGNTGINFGAPPPPSSKLGCPLRCCWGRRHLYHSAPRQPQPMLPPGRRRPAGSLPRAQRGGPWSVAGAGLVRRNMDPGGARLRALSPTCARVANQTEAVAGTDGMRSLIQLCVASDGRAGAPGGGGEGG